MILSRVFAHFRDSTKAFVRAPGLALSLLFTIALGVGSNVSMYAFIQGLVDSHLPRVNTERMVSIFSHDQFGGAGPVSRSEYQLLKDRGDAFEWVGAARIAPKAIELRDRSEVAIVAAVTPSLANPLRLAQGNGIVISHRMWQSEFAGANPLGNQIRIDQVKASDPGSCT